ncbi:hypothetical protein [Aureimonas leprariae]|uniref:Uncharacterized protein n=1 Tax=Plantimonas leprariae TaxID=2615207 RepID=A0A7V7TUI9_9HYPH|nr:hypothetical protein [Aureimonas leprariae]KAB0676004.1 hypothetical protein F6X38_22340 [Aureimonas leprariae]
MSANILMLPEPRWTARPRNGVFRVFQYRSGLWAFEDESKRVLRDGLTRSQAVNLALVAAEELGFDLFIEGDAV